MSTWNTISVIGAKLLTPLGLLLLAGVAFVSIRRRRKLYADGAEAYKSSVENDLIEPTTLHPEIDATRCTGCTACVKACPEGEILKVINHKAVLVQPNMCVGHGECEIACPFGAIDLVFGTKRRGMDLPRITSNYETNVKGVYIAGELGGMGLIRNAVRQGRTAAMHALAKLPGNARADFDLVIVGAGTAGLAASLAATQARANYLCIEQNSVGGTIYNFPRQKIVMTQPADLPLVGTMEFPNNKVSKEELLQYWTHLRRRYSLRIKEGCKFEGFSKYGEIFQVKTSLGSLTAKKVILATGVRGTPRRLNVPGENLPKVTYNLLEPEQYQKQDIAVIGGGNAALEAAVQLAQPRLRNRVSLIVRSRQFNRANQENIDNVNALALHGQIWVIFESQVKSIHQSHIIVNHGGSPIKMNNSFVFIFAGSEVPKEFLASLGVKMDKKFGERLRKT
ncbi:MAG: 4Fe-4S dicluster domain-containing protein [Deltaproteobacteria bacterium]|nr:4Fe-4S dicluster domain-containing protein [Deltaproteobacteria bacterium]